MTAIRVLLVDDDEDVRFSTCLLLETLGYDVVQAEDIPTALDLLQEEPSIALLFTDIRLGGDQNGFDLAEQAKAACPDLKVLFASGSPAPQNNLDHQTIRKPYRLDDLGPTLERVLEKP